jgi:hypothetical protein
MRNRWNSKSNNPMKIIFLRCLLLLLILSSCNIQKPGDSITLPPSISVSDNSQKITCTETDTLQLKYGKSFGECIGYCRADWEIHPCEMIQIKSGYDKEKYPDITKHFALSKADYKELTSLINIEEFLKLPERIGCPDCNDGGAEWVELTIGNVPRKVLFEFGDSINGIHKFVKRFHTYPPRIR